PYQPSTYLITTFLTLLAIAFTPKGAWLTFIFYALGIIFWLLKNRLFKRSLFLKVSVEFLFVSLILLSSLFQTGGKIIWSWGWLQISSNGIITLGTVTFKLFLSLLIVNILLYQLTQSQILNSLLTLKVPPLLVAIMGSMLRYLQLLNREFQTVRRAALSRNLTLTPQSTRLILANGIGSLFIRTYDRGERIHQAMVARGYTGLPEQDTQNPLKFTIKEKQFLGCVIIWLLLGQFL
ncbi:MAG: energy-coupling factor transporter transmembrane component T family protein, partial [Microcystaceae cyanobacterium]